MDFIELLKVIFLGIVEGITEWLPISSTGHLILVEEFVKLDVSKQFWEMFMVVIQLGAIITVRDEDKQDIVPIARRFEALGYRIYATRSTARVLNENGVKAVRTNKIEQASPNLMDLILGHKIDLVIDTPVSMAFRRIINPSFAFSTP